MAGRDPESGLKYLFYAAMCVALAWIIIFVLYTK